MLNLRFILLGILLFPLSLYAQQSNNELNLELSSEKNAHPVFLSVKGGLSYLTASVKDSKEAFKRQGVESTKADDFYNDFKWGHHLRARLGMGITEQIGAGISYRYFGTSASMMSYLDPMDGVHLYYGKISEKVLLNFVGGSFYGKHAFNEKWEFSATYSMGYTKLRDEVIMLNQPLLITGGTLSLDFDCELDYKITPKLSANLGLGLFIANFKKVKMDDGYYNETVELSKDEYLNYSALDLSVGLSYRF